MSLEKKRRPCQGGADLLDDDQRPTYSENPIPAMRSYGGRPPRRRPADFEQRFIELGWERTPLHYCTSNRMVSRWLDEAGKDRLVRLRAAHVSHQRRRIADPGKPLVPVLAERLDPQIVREAAHFLRHARAGGWVTYPLATGEWVVGTHRRTESELLKMARAKGWRAFA